MSQIDQLREQIDACRPGSDDLSLPALVDLARAADQDQAVAIELARGQQFDRAVVSAMHDVPVPSGFLDRLLVATQIANPEVELPAPSAAIAARGLGASRFTRRKWIAGGSVALLALVTVSASVFWLRPARVIGQGELSAAVEAWLKALPVDPGAWTPTSKTPVPAQFPIDLAVVRQAHSFQKFRAAGADTRPVNCAAISLAPPLEPRAILFVVPTSARYNVPSIPGTTARLSLSRGFTATAWQRKDSKFLYVLVVEEDRGQRLEGFLHQQLAKLLGRVQLTATS